KWKILRLTSCFLECRTVVPICKDHPVVVRDNGFQNIVLKIHRVLPIFHIYHIGNGSIFVSKCSRYRAVIFIVQNQKRRKYRPCIKKPIVAYRLVLYEVKLLCSSWVVKKAAFCRKSV